MGKGKILGEFELVVLVAVARLEGDGYGVTVLREIEDRIGRQVAVGAVYSTLERLSAKGYVNARSGAPEPGRGGRPKRFFSLTRSGAQVLKASRRMQERLWEGVELDRQVRS